MKVGLIYTSTTPELIELVEQEVKKQLGDDVELYSLQDPSILADVRAAGYVTTAPAARLIGMYMKAAEEGVDAMLNLCSSVGEVADSAQDVAKYIGVPIVRVDEEMCREAVRKGQRIGVMATLPTTLEPTKGTILRMARECNRHVELVDCLVDGAFGLDQDQFKARMTEMAGTIADKVDVIVFAQGSMAYCEQYIADKFGKVVLSSPRFGAAELKKALEGTDTAAIKAATEALTTTSYEIFGKAYQAQSEQGTQGAPGAQGAAPKDDNVVDADYEVVDDDKNQK